MKYLRALTCSLTAALCVSASAAELVIGQVASVSDPASIGNLVRLGAQLHFDLVNRAGGVHGMSLRLVTRDRSSKPDEAVSKTRELLRDTRPVALLGLMGTGAMEALVRSRVLDEERIPVVGIRTGAPSLHASGANEWLFHTRASYAGEIDRIARHLATIGARRVAVFHEASPFGIEALALAERAAARHGMAIVARGRSDQASVDVKAALAAIAPANPEAIIVAASSEAAAEFYASYRRSGGGAMVVALSTTDGALVVKRIGKAAARGLGIAHVVPDPANASLPLAREMQDLRRRGHMNGVEPNQGVLEGYVAAKVLVEALRRAGPGPTRAKLRQALEAMSAYDVGGLVIGFSPTRRTGSDYVDIAILSHDGKMLR